jgi:hypothetical protein
MIQHHFQLESLHNQVALSISINDILVFVDRFHTMPNNQVSINQWLYNGDNTIDVNISVNPRFEHQLRAQDASVKIVHYAGAKPDFIPSTVMELLWMYVPDETKFPVNLHDSFPIDIPYGNWTWLNATPLTKETIPWDSLHEFLARIHAALSAKDFNALEPILRTKAAELAHAYSIELSERLAGQADFFRDLFANPSWGMQPLDLNTVQPIFHAQGRLIEFVDPRGVSPLKSTDLDGDTFSLPMRLCLVDDTWVLCR